jgi:cytochrome c oxidase subunit II
MKRALFAFVPVLFLTGALAACGGGDDGGGSSGDTLPPEAEAGRELAQDRGCPSCHSSNGDRGTGPTWEGLYGSEVELSDGTTVTVDDAYIRESILDPAAKLVDGYGNVMPKFDMTDEEIAQITAYIQSLA